MTDIRAQKQTYRLDEATYAVALAFNMTASAIAAGFGWRPIPSGPLAAPFWRCWRTNKLTMRAAGYRVTRSEDGPWMLMRDPPGEPLPATAERPALRLVHTERATP
jgi:hypothetical protein